MKIQPEVSENQPKIGKKQSRSTLTSPNGPGYYVSLGGAISDALIHTAIL